MTEPEPTPAADEPPSSAAPRGGPASDGEPGLAAADPAVPDAAPPGDRSGADDWAPTGPGRDRSISGVDIREIDTSDLVEVERLFGLSGPTGPAGVEPVPQADAEVPSAVPVADPVAAFYAARWAPEDETVDRRYRGRRRVKVAEPRLWAAALAVLAVIGGLLYWGLSLAPSQGVGPLAPTESTTASFPIIAIEPTGSASVLPSATPTAAPPSPLPTTGRSSVPLPPFAPLTIEAESGTVGGSAEAVRNNRASGRHIVQQLGNWGSGAPGTLTIVTGILPVVGTYAMTISYQHSDAEPTRTAIITVNSVALAPTTFAVPDGTCCYTLTIQLTLRAGTNTIFFSNPTGHAPALDKLVITRPS